MAAPRFIGLASAAIVLAGCSTGVWPGETAPAATVAPVPTLDSGQVEGGRHLYAQYCASCHGWSGEGVPNWQQPDASGNLPPPPHDDAGHTWRHGDAQLVEIIRNGQRDPFNKSPDLTMPPFKDQLSDGDIVALITYFKSLWLPEHRRYQEEQSQRQGTPMSAGGE